MARIPTHVFRKNNSHNIYLTVNYKYKHIYIYPRSLFIGNKGWSNNVYSILCNWITMKIKTSLSHVFCYLDREGGRERLTITEPRRRRKKLKKRGKVKGVELSPKFWLAEYGREAGDWRLSVRGIARELYCDVNKYPSY